MYLSLVDMSIRRSDLPKYAEYRRRHINPAMHATGAFVGSHLLSAGEADDSAVGMRCVLINFWCDLAVQKRFASSKSHIAHLEEVKALAHITSVQSLERLDGLSFGSADQDATPACVIVRHRCHAGRSGDYVAAWATLRKRVEEVGECVAVAVCADIADRDSFVVLYWWTSETRADAFSAEAGEEAKQAGLTGDIVADGLDSAVRYCSVRQ